LFILYFLRLKAHAVMLHSISAQAILKIVIFETDLSNKSVLSSPAYWHAVMMVV